MDMKIGSIKGKQVIAALAAIGGLNWVLVGAASTDLVNTIFGGLRNIYVPQAIYVIAGAAGVYAAYKYMKGR